MRIAVDGRTIQDHFPGIARYAFNLACAMARVAPDDDLFLLYDRAARNTRYDLSALELHHNAQLVAAEAGVFSWCEQWRIPRQLGRLGCDVILAPYYVRPYLMPAPVVFTAHDLIPMLYPEYFTTQERLIFALTMGLAWRTARKVIAVSRATAQDLERLMGVPPRQLAVVPEAADPAFMPQSAAMIASVKYTYHLPEEYALYLGSNKPHKNLVRLVEAWAQIASRVSAKLVIAGHWDERFPQSRERAAALGLGTSVHFVGPVGERDLPAVYAGAKLFVFPSLYEGFGLPVLEAMACGVPVVCSWASSLPEVAGEAALLVDPTDTHTLAMAMRRVLEDTSLAAELRAKGLAQAARHSWERAARETLAIMASCRGA